MNMNYNALYYEARQWIADVFEDAPKDLTDSEVTKGINRHYEGGWVQFVSDNAELLK